MQYFKWLCLTVFFIFSCQAANYLTIDDCDADRDGDFAIGVCGGNDCDDQDGRKSSLHGEVCNDKIDNNCNDKIDENCSCINDGDVRPCYIAEDGKAFFITYPSDGGMGASTCRPGQQECRSGMWGACLGAQGPLAEVCDMKDNDCDGKIDNGFMTFTNCTVGTGSCFRSGKYVCSSPSTNTCGAQPDPPNDEYTDHSINGSWDYNCNGSIEKACCENGLCSSCESYENYPIGSICTCCAGLACCDAGAEACSTSYVCRRLLRINKKPGSLNCGDTAKIYDCQCNSSCEVTNRTEITLKVNCK